MQTILERAAAHVGLKRPIPLPAGSSLGKKWKFRRNLVIYVAAAAGMSQRVLADVFDLPRSRIASIIDEYRVYEGTHAV